MYAYTIVLIFKLKTSHLHITQKHDMSLKSSAWTSNAERALQVAVSQHGKNWDKVGCLLGRGRISCKRYWESTLEPKLIFGLKIQGIIQDASKLTTEEPEDQDPVQISETNSAQCIGETQSPVEQQVNSVCPELNGNDDESEQDAVCREITSLHVEIMRFERYREVEIILNELQNFVNVNDAQCMRHIQVMVAIRSGFAERMVRNSHLSKMAVKDLVRKTQKKFKCEAEQLLYYWWTCKPCELNLTPVSMNNPTFKEVVKMFCTKQFH